MRKFMTIIDNLLTETIHLDGFAELTKTSDTFRQFLLKADSKFMDVLYRGHMENSVSNHSFMTDSISHAEEYGRDGKVDAFAYDPSDVMFFNDAVFNELRTHYRKLSPLAFKQAYKEALTGNPYAGEFDYWFPIVKKIIRSDVQYEKNISWDFEKNNALVPLMTQYAANHGKTIIAFLGGDYADYGGQNEFVVADMSKLIDLRNLYDQVKSQ